MSYPSSPPLSSHCALASRRPVWAPSRWLDIERTPLSLAIFSVFDDDATGMISFAEFVLSTWCFASAPPSMVPDFAFNLYAKVPWVPWVP